MLVLPDDAVATFTAENAGASGDVTYTWNFGDGTAALSTAESTVSHTYTAGGVDEVSVSASDGVHSSYYILPKKVAVYTMSFTCIADSDRVVEGGTIVVIKDSFSHCFAPFLAENYHKVIQMLCLIL